MLDNKVSGMSSVSHCRMTEKELSPEQQRLLGLIGLRCSYNSHADFHMAGFRHVPHVVWNRGPHLV